MKHLGICLAALEKSDKKSYSDQGPRRYKVGMQLTIPLHFVFLTLKSLRNTRTDAVNGKQSARIIFCC
jgi:hypothetical protein